MKFKKLSEWLTWLETLHPQWMELGLDRVGAVAKILNLTEFACPVITVTGTNGKGSTVALLEAIYLAAGYRVGAYTSPHLLQFNERIRIQGIEVADENLCHAFEQIEAIRQQTSLTYFEYTTLAAFYLFQRANLEVLILEVGLGGRLDAVNLVDADVAVVTTIALDHEAWLGDNREAIGYEKAGIMRSHKPIVCGDLSPPQSILAHALQLSAPFYGLNRDFQFQKRATTWQLQTPLQTYGELPIPKIALQNAATALMAMDLLQKRLPVKSAAIKKAIEQVFLPGRFQKIPGPVTTILDVAHNPAGGAWLAECLRQESKTGRVLAVFSMLTDKHIAETLQPLVAEMDAWFTGPLTAPRAASSAQLTEALQIVGVLDAHIATSFTLAYQAALSYAKPGDKLLVFGSFYAVAQVLQALKISSGDT